MIESKLEKVILGLDLGKKRDYSALCAVERRQNYYVAPYERKITGPPFYRLTYLERFPLETDYPAVLEGTRRIFENAANLYREKRVKPQLIIDATGVGIPMYDYFRKEIPSAKGCYITGGQAVTKDQGVFFVPKQSLAAILEIVFQERRIKIGKNVKDAQTLKNEMMNFRYKTNPDTGNTSFEAWRERDHDDCVLAVAIALWYGERNTKWGW